MHLVQSCVSIVIRIAGDLGKMAKKIAGDLRFMLKNLHKSLFFCTFAVDFNYKYKTLNVYFMEIKPLRPWIVTSIVAFFAFIAYVMCGSAMPSLAKATNIELGTILKGFQAGNLLIYCIMLVAWLMSGLRVWQNDKGNKTAQYGGILLVCYGIVGLVWQALALIGLFTQTNLVPMPLYITLTIVTAVLIGAAMIVLAIYYRHKAMLWLSVCYVALSVLYTPLHLLMLYGSNRSTAIRVAYTLASSAAEILQIVYLFKWAKRVKEA